MTSYYQKPTKTPYCILASSAMPQQMVENSLTQEVVRRLSNTSIGLLKDMTDSLEELIARMRRSGHSLAVVARVMERGLKIYHEKARNQELGLDKIHKRAKDTANKRRVKKLMLHKTWFKPKTTKPSAKTSCNKMPCQKPNTNPQWDNRAPDTALFIPRTPGGALATLMRQSEKDLGKVSTFKMKIVEECGTDLKGALVKSNPWAKEDCKRADCPLCQARREGDDEAKGSCKAKSITYTSTCTLCREMGHKTEYIGESGRSLYERSREHVRQSMTSQSKSHIREHMSAQHPETAPHPGAFRFSVTGTYFAPLDRQLSEAIKITRASGTKTTVLNSKFEFNRCLIPTLVTEDPKPKPHQTHQIAINRDPEEDEGDDWWDDDNPQKRVRNQETRNRKPTKRTKPNKPHETSQKEVEIQGEGKRKPNQTRVSEGKPAKTRRKIVIEPRRKTRNDDIQAKNQTKTQESDQNHNKEENQLKSTEPKPGTREPSIDPSEETPTDIPTDNGPDILCQSPQRTPPQSTKVLPAVESETDRMTKFIGLFNREGAISTR